MSVERENLKYQLICWRAMTGLSIKATVKNRDGQLERVDLPFDNDQFEELKKYMILYLERKLS